MSVFRGSISEYPGVIVDHFVSANCKRGRVFFLSHCHKDHMTGLSSPNIVSALQRLHTHLLCSEVTKSLLLKDPEFTQLASYLRSLPMEEPVVMNVEASGLDEKLNFTVTLLPAGHCPGSSMFFFQGDRGNVLYTGDFRLTLEETKRLRPLHCGESLLDITTLYVDTTFYHPIATEIPSRDISRDLILKLIESWLSKHLTNVVHLQCAMFGYEHIYMGVYKKFKTKIHIAAWRINAYREISAVTDCLTTDGESTRIHACTYRKGQQRTLGLPCGSCEKNGSPNVLRIKPSTQWFLFNEKSSTPQPYVFLPQFNKLRVIHSMHASYSELQDFITYIKPKRIVPCVIPSGDSSLTDVCTRLKRLLPQTEVTCAYSDSKQGSAKGKIKRSNDKKSAGRVHTETTEATETTESDDSWSTGDDSIDEFTNTEEQQLSVEKTAFCHTSQIMHVALPSLLSVEEREASPQPSTSSVTVGSLKQSPIDLLLGSPSLESASQTAVTGVYLATTSSTEQSTAKLSQLSYDDNSNYLQEKGGDIIDMKGEFEYEPKKPNETGDWCLKYECSPPPGIDIGSTPPTKRTRVSGASNSVSRKLFKCSRVWIDPGDQNNTHPQDAHGSTTSSFIDLTQDEQTSDQSDCVAVSTPPQMVDLTHEDQQTPSELHCHTSNTGHKVPDITPGRTNTGTSIVPCTTEELAAFGPLVELSDSQSSGSTVVGSATGRRSASVESGVGHGSPGYLPPTPGRENVGSILQRPDFP